MRWPGGRVCVWVWRGLALLAVIAGWLGLTSARAFASGIDLGGLLPRTSTCALCTNYVTTFDPDGESGVPPFTRMHRNLLVNVPYVLDVDGNLPPLPLAPLDVGLQVVVGGHDVLPTVPGYELRAVVQTLTGERPTVRLSKLPTAPARLPVRAEIVTGEVQDTAARKTTFGYDALRTTAPRSFVARLDLSDRDANSATDQVLVGIEITGPGDRLAIVSENFTGDPAAVRANRHVRRADLIGDPSRGTRVPSAVSLDVTTSATRQHVVLTRSERTTLEFELSQPGGNPRSGGRLDEMPPSLDLTIADADVNGDGTADKKIDYLGAAEIGHAVFTTKNGASTTTASVNGVPREVHLTYANPTGRTEVTYRANSRASRAEITVADDQKSFNALLENLPANINQLTHTSTPDGGTVVYKADASADRAEVHTRNGNATFDASVDGVPASIDHLTYTTPPGRVTIDHAASSAIPHAEVNFGALIPPDGSTPAHHRSLAATVDGFPSSVDLVLDTQANTVSYTASGRTPRIHVVVDDEQPLFERATSVDLLLEDVSPGLDATLKKERLELDARGDHVGKIEVVGTNTTEQRLAAEEDGVLIRDFDRPGLNDYVLFGRVRGLRHALYLPGDHRTYIEFDAVPPAGTDLVVDSQRDVLDRLWTNQISEDVLEHHDRDGTETLEATLADYPPGMTFDLNTADDEMHVEYGAARPAGIMAFSRTINYRGDPIPVTYKRQYTADRIAGSYPTSAFNSEMTARLDPMPAMFHACYVPRGDECSAGTWERDMFEDFNPASSNNGGSLRFRASTRTQFTLDDRKTVSVPITYARFGPEVAEAGDECEKSVFFGLLCRYDDDKPGLATTHIDLSLGDLIIQSHLESSGWVGHNVASIFAGDAANNQGYVAMDTGWRNAEIVTGPELCEALGFEPNCIFGFLHGHYPPPPEVAIHGQIAKGGSGCVVGEDCEALESTFSAGFAAKIDALTLDYGDPFAAEHRVFEFDPDELIFAKHRSGHVHCGAGTSLKAGSSGFESDFCEISLPAPEG
jgi:hypothetical protein